MLSTSASASKQIIQSNCYILTFLAQSLACPWQFLSRVESDWGWVPFDRLSILFLFK